MEHSEVNFQAIISFIESLEITTPPIKIDHLTDGHLLLKMLEMIEQFSLGDEELAPAANWAIDLNNNKVILKHLCQYSTQYLNKELEIEDVDLLSISKTKNINQTSKLFFLVLTVLVQSTSKQYFISKLTSLNTEHQKYFMHMIQCSISKNGSGSEINVERSLLKKVTETELENERLRAELTILMEENNKVKTNMAELNNKLILSSSQFQKLRLQKQELEKEKDKKIPKYELKTIQNLKQRIKTMVIEHSKQISKYQQQISILANQSYRVAELQKMVENYKQNYDQAVQYVKEANNWSSEKQKITKQIQQKNKTIVELEELTEDSNKKIQELQEQIVELQISNQKLILRNNELQSSSSRKSNQHRLSLMLDRAPPSLSQLIPETNQQNINKDEQLQKELESKNKKIQNLEKEVEKLKFKADRVNQVEKEKSRLETLIMEQNQSRMDEIELLTTCLYDLRTKYKSLYEETKAN